MEMRVDDVSSRSLRAEDLNTNKSESRANRKIQKHLDFELNQPNFIDQSEIQNMAIKC
jgi:hypothetical protein